MDEQIKQTRVIAVPVLKTAAGALTVLWLLVGALLFMGDVADRAGCGSG